MAEESEKRPVGRPKNHTAPHVIQINTADPVTYRMLDALMAYGRFGRTVPEVALFIIRAWLMEKEEYLKSAIATRKSPLGEVYPEADREE